MLTRCALLPQHNAPAHVYIGVEQLSQQTWHSVTCTCFDIWRSIFVEWGFVAMMRSSRPQSRMLTACLKNSIWLERGTFLTNVANVLMWRVLKN